MNLFQKYMILKEESNSENFTKWFGKSILHDDGVPYTFYHGTGDPIEKFSHDFIGKGNDSYGAGFYFANKPSVASGYASMKDDKTPNVIPVHLKLTKPIHVDSKKPFVRSHIERMIRSAPEHEESLNNFGDVSYEGYHKVLRQAVDSYTNTPKISALHSLNHDFYLNKEKELLTNLTKITGHDGVISKNGEHIVVNVFHPNQIKSVFNKGGYSKKSDSISENFDSWFSKSTAVDSQGKPSRFYHGTSSQFSEFKSGTGNQWGAGHYFIKNPKTASEYATGDTTGIHSRIAPEGNVHPNIVPVYLSMKKPFIMDDVMTNGTRKKIEKHLGQDLSEHVWPNMKNRDIRQVLHTQFVNTQDEANDILKKVGFDGIRERSDDSIHMVFHPNQIKSVFNKGTFSKKTNNISESDRQD